MTRRMKMKMKTIMMMYKYAIEQFLPHLAIAVHLTFKIHACCCH